MRKYVMWTIPPIALILGCVSLPIVSAQTAVPPKSVDDIKIEKWNSVPLPGSAYAGLRSAPILHAATSPEFGMPQATPRLGRRRVFRHPRNEHRAVLPGNNVPPGAEPDESISRTLSLTPLSARRRSRLTSPPEWACARFPTCLEMTPSISATRLDSPGWILPNSGPSKSRRQRTR